MKTMNVKTKNWLRWTTAGAFGLMLGLNVMIGLDFKKNKTIPSLTLTELGNQAQAQGESGDGGCSWLMIDCPGWGTGDYEACLENGDGNTCSCGQVTRDCVSN